MCGGRERTPSTPVAFQDTCARLAALTALSVLTVLLRIAWGTMAAMVTRVVADGRDTNDLLSGLVRTGIDEIAFARGIATTVVVDHETGRLVWGGRGPRPRHPGEGLRPAGCRAGHAAHPRRLRRRAMDRLTAR
jgi:hypothetical protein